MISAPRLQVSNSFSSSGPISETLISTIEKKIKKIPPSLLEKVYLFLSIYFLISL